MPINEDVRLDDNSLSNGSFNREAPSIDLGVDALDHGALTAYVGKFHRHCFLH
jgi:hypothetical protein